MFLAPPDRAIVFYGASLQYVLVQMPLFLIGSLLGLLPNRFRMFGRSDLCLLFLTLNFGISTWFGWWSLPIEWLTLPYMVISFGLLSLPGLNRIGHFGDVSYGLYLYAFPVQQLVLYFLPAIHMPILACTLLTLLPAFLSWHLVERPALHLKPGGPSRGGSGPRSARALGLHMAEPATVSPPLVSDGDCLKVGGVGTAKIFSRPFCLFRGSTRGLDCAAGADRG